MTVSKKFRFDPTHGVDGVISDGIVALRNIIGVMDGQGIHNGTSVFLTRTEVTLLYDWFEELLKDDEVWKKGR